MCQVGATAPRETVAVGAVPFMSTIVTSVVAVFCQRMSVLPSPLKSPVPTTYIPLAETPRETVPETPVPAITRH